MEDLTGKIFYKKGTKQRFQVIDKYCFCDDYVIVGLKHLKNWNYKKSYWNKRISKEDLFKNYILIEDKNEVIK